MAYTYILQLDSGKYYVGSCHNIYRRFQEHLNGRTFSTHDKNPRLLYYEEHELYEDALKREMQIKGWSRVKKEKLISGEWGKQDFGKGRLS